MRGRGIDALARRCCMTLTEATQGAEGLAGPRLVHLHAGEGLLEDAILGAVGQEALEIVPACTAAQSITDVRVRPCYSKKSLQVHCVKFFSRAP